MTSPQSVAARNFMDLATLIAGGRLEQKGKIFGGFKWRGTQAAPAEGS
jgi:hypothetical protein